MKPISMLILIGLLTLGASQAAEITKGPLIKGYGGHLKVKSLDYPIPKGAMKVVFDVSKTSDEPDQLNRNLNTPARFLNMHAANGVKAEHMKLAIVIHGGAAKDLLKNQAYQKRFMVDNPNINLLDALHNNGVRIIVCGQTKEYRGYKDEELLPFVEVSLSAMTALVDLQQKGYALIAF
ncbi:MAG: DsrE family protein [bacterium]